MKLVNTRGRRGAVRILALSAFVFALAMGANAQWQVINLNPAGATSSGAIGVGDGLQAGRAAVGGITRASLWSGSARSWVDLHPVAMAGSHAMGVDGGSVAGFVFDAAGVYHASLWSGTANSWVDLHPVGAEQSFAMDVHDGQVVGMAKVDGQFHAGLWHGTASSWVNLHPDGATESQALGADGGLQVGYVADAAGVRHASVWSGSAASWVDLNPDGAEQSTAEDVDGDQVVGSAKVNGGGACLWNRAGDSWVWVGLHPAGLNEMSAAFAVHAGEQVGVVFNNDPYHAALWRGTADSYVDLHAFLPREFGESLASGIWHDAEYTYVVGYGYNTKRQRQEALMWRAESSTPPPPAETGTIEGRVFGPNNKAVSGALVTATAADGNKWETTSAGKQGSYTLSDLPAGSYTVEGIKDGVGYGRLDGVQVIAGGTTSGVDLHLLPY